jgi:hypothetical protein
MAALNIMFGASDATSRSDESEIRTNVPDIINVLVVKLTSKFQLATLKTKRQGHGAMENYMHEAHEIVAQYLSSI